MPEIVSIAEAILIAKKDFQLTTPEMKIQRPRTLSMTVL
jgi:hypothetical protein